MLDGHGSGRAAHKVHAVGSGIGMHQGERCRRDLIAQGQHTAKMASMPPAAPSKWPVADLVELTAIRASRPNMALMASSSPRSPSGVEADRASLQEGRLALLRESGLAPKTSVPPVSSHKHSYVPLQKALVFFRRRLA